MHFSRVGFLAQVAFCSLIIAVTSSDFDLCYHEKETRKPSIEEKKFLIVTMRRGLKCFPIVTRAVAQVSFDIAPLVEKGIKLMCYTHRVCDASLNRNASSRSRFELTETETQNYLKCNRRFIQFIDPKAVSMVMKIPEKDAASVDLEKIFTEINDCAMKYFKTLPGDMGTMLKLAEMFRQQMGSLLKKN